MANKIIENYLNMLYGKDYDKKIYPASLTKLVTLITGNLPSLA